MSEMQLREILDTDLAELGALLAEGFPRRTLAYWQSALAILARRPAVEGYPRYGYALEVDGRIEGVLLLLTAEIDGMVRCNLSSWYVREAHRKFATFMFQRAIRAKGGVYLNLSPSPTALPIAEAFGFKHYTAGTLLLDARSALKRGYSVVRPLGTTAIDRLDAAERGIVNDHLNYGCSGFLLEDTVGPMVALYRIKWLKRLVPAARFVSGNPARLVAASGGVMRALIRRGLPLCLIDAPPDLTPPTGVRLLPSRDRRYAKGGVPPPPGDLRETEIALFGP